MQSSSFKVRSKFKVGTDCVEEIDECVGWLELMRDGGIASDETLLAEARELSAILTTAQKTARANSARMRAKP